MRKTISTISRNKKRIKNNNTQENTQKKINEILSMIDPFGKIIITSDEDVGFLSYSNEIFNFELKSWYMLAAWKWATPNDALIDLFEWLKSWFYIKTIDWYLKFIFKDWEFKKAVRLCNYIVPPIKDVSLAYYLEN